MVGEKTSVCGKSARWWDNEIKDKINRRVVSGRKELWDEYCRLCKEVKEVKEAVREKNWNEIVEKVNADFEGSRKEVGTFVGRRTRAAVFCYLA